MVVLATIKTITWARPEAYFSPEGGVRDQILRRINLSRRSIDIAIFDFTSGEIAAALANAAQRGVRIRVVADRRQASGKHSEVPYLAETELPARVSSGRGRGIMHNKFAVFDERVAVTGSYNWTHNAERFNYENLLVEDDPDIAAAYHREFETLWRLATPVVQPKPALPDAVYRKWRALMDKLWALWRRILK